MSTAPRRTPGPLLALLAAAPLALAVGCGAPGELRDHGAAEAVARPPARIPLWPGQDTAPSPEPAGPRTPEPAPQPVPDLTVPGQDVSTVDVRTLLAKDPGVSQDERRALDPCTGCGIRPAEYRDLTGDGRPELLVVVGLVDTDVLHVYTASADRMLPVLRVQLLKRFGAETLGTDLLLYESTTSWSRTIRRYSWDGARLVLAEQKVEGVGPVQEPEPTPTTTPGDRSTILRPGTGTVPAPWPSVPAVRRPDGSEPGAGAGSGAGAPTATPVPAPKVPQPGQPRPAVPTAAPTAQQPAAQQPTTQQPAAQQPTAQPPARSETTP
ncbi:hypothetical protein ACFVVL_21910 [Kitasatospora sp. NPDC058115]|uniref:hypothetical protein n=1 Tax=Kitasatospora sp. NPDC058115 TaxID=3346347 RepID=UPI0036DA70AA